MKVGPAVKRGLVARLPEIFSRCAVAVLFFTVGALLVYLVRRGLPEFGMELLFGKTPPLEAIFAGRPVWEGIWPALVGTFCLIGLTLCLALAPGIGCGVYLAEYAGPRARRVAGAAVDVLAGTPSIVMGLFGFTLILFLRRTVMPDANTCLLLAAGCLALLVLPVLIVNTREALEAVPDELRAAAAASGFSKGQRLRNILLPSAGQGIGGGVILALGRAAEDTAVIMLTGVVANAGLPAGIGAKFEALPFTVYYIAAQYQDQAELARGFGASLVLLCLSCGLVLLARCMERGFRKRWKGTR